MDSMSWCLGPSPTHSNPSALHRTHVQLSDLTKDTATRVVGNNNVPEAMTALRGRVDATEARISKMADKSFRCLEDEMNSVRSEVKTTNMYAKPCVTVVEH